MTPRVVALAAVALLTLGLFTFGNRWDPLGAPFFGPDMCSGGLAGWRTGPGAGSVECRDGALRLVTDETGSQARARLVVPRPAGAEYVGFSVRASRAVDSPGGEGFVSLIQLDEKAARWDFRHPDFTIGAESGQAHDDVVRIGEPVRNFLLVAKVKGPGETMTVESVELRPLVVDPVFSATRTAFAGLWIAAGLWLATGWIRQRGLVPWRALATLVVVLIVAGTLLPGPGSRRASTTLETSLTTTLNDVARRVQAPPAVGEHASEPEPGAATRPESAPRPEQPAEPVTPPREKPATPSRPAPRTADSSPAPRAEASAPPLLTRRLDLDFVKKIGHVTLFALLGFAVRRSSALRAAAGALLALIVLSAAMETLQLFAIDRTPRPLDALFNMSGALAGWTIAHVSAASQRRSADVQDAGRGA